MRLDSSTSTVIRSKPLPRESIKMNSDELRDFLITDNRLVLGTIGPDSEPWADMVAYAFADDRIFFRVAEDSRSRHNIRRDPRVACAIESHPKGSEYYAIRGATCHGIAKEGASKAIRDALAAIPDPVVEAPTETKGMIFSIDIEDQLSFMFSKIKYRYQDKHSA